MKRRVLSTLAAISLATAGLVGLQAVQAAEAQAVTFTCGSYTEFRVKNYYCSSARSVAKGSGGTTYGPWVGKNRDSVNSFCHRTLYSYGAQYYR
jgi:hypothetical protein